jgi:hypothetical protein
MQLSIYYKGIDSRIVSSISAFFQPSDLNAFHIDGALPQFYIMVGYEPEGCLFIMKP